MDRAVSTRIGGYGPAGLARGLQSAGLELTGLVTLTIFVTRQVTGLVTIGPAWGRFVGGNPRILAQAGVGTGFACWLVPPAIDRAGLGDTTMRDITLIIRRNGTDHTINGLGIETALLIARSLHITEPRIRIEIWAGATQTHTFA